MIRGLDLDLLRNFITILIIYQTCLRLFISWDTSGCYQFIYRDWPVQGGSVMLLMLETLQSVDIFHGDFKPDNLLFRYASVVTGLLGIGGGSILGPMFLELGVPPQILDHEAVAEVREHREIPEIKPGYIIELKLVVLENKRRVSTVKGIVIARRNAGLNSTFRVRRLVAGVGVESLFPLLKGTMTTTPPIYTRDQRLLDASHRDLLKKGHSSSTEHRPNKYECSQSIVFGATPVEREAQRHCTVFRHPTYQLLILLSTWERKESRQKT